jgi:hypothetical protein
MTGMLPEFLTTAFWSVVPRRSARSGGDTGDIDRPEATVREIAADSIVQPRAFCPRVAAFVTVRAECHERTDQYHYCAMTQEFDAKILHR